MNRYCSYGLILVLESIAVFLFFQQSELIDLTLLSLRRTKDVLDEQGKMRLLERRQELGDVVRKNTLWVKWNRFLDYCGLRRILPNLTVEYFFAFNVIYGAGLLGIGMFFGGIRAGLLGSGGGLLVEFLFLQLIRGMNEASVNRNMLKLLDFLGNYSCSSGEITTILRQVAVYMEQPLQGVLEECDAESRISGDVSMALLSMTEKIEHPQFCSFVRNLEISTRYSADYNALISESRRSMREYLRAREEEKGMLREAMINMVLLGILSAVVLMVVGKLIGVSMDLILFHTIPGYIALAGMGLIGGLFTIQAWSIRK